MAWWCHIIGLVNWVIVDSVNGLSPVQHQAIIWNKADILLIWPIRTNFSEILIKIQWFLFKKTNWKNVVCNMAAILSGPQYVVVVCDSPGVSISRITPAPVGSHHLIRGNSDLQDQLIRSIINPLTYWIYLDKTKQKNICLCFLSFLNPQMMCRLWKSFHKEDMDPFVPQSQYHGCWWPGDLRTDLARNGNPGCANEILRCAKCHFWWKSQGK